MTSPTHITFAEFVYLLILTTTGVSLSLGNSFVIAVSSLLPDMDTAVSTAGKIFPFVSGKLERKFGHRTLTHSVPCLACIGIVCLPVYLLSSDIYICSVVGYASHLFLDTMTVNGVKLFFPFSSVKCVFPFEVNNPHRYRLQTGSKTDTMLMVIFAIGCIPTLAVALQGYERFVRSTQQNIEAAVRDYNEFSRNHLVFARVEGYGALTKQPLNGRVEIIGALNPHTLVFKCPDGQLHTLGKEFQADYVVENILCSPGEKMQSFIRNIDLSNQLLSQVSACIDSSAENYFFGDLTTSDKVSLPENIKMFTPVTGSGSIVRFNFATYDNIKTFNLEDVFITKGILTIKSISPVRQGTGRPSTDPGLPRLENYTQLSLTLDPKESVEILKQRGDTLHEKDLLARKNIARLYHEEIQLNQDNISARESQKTAELSDLDGKISNIVLALHTDSLEYEHNIELSGNHYIPASLLDNSLLKWRKDRQILSELISARSKQMQKFSLEIRKLEIQNSELHAKARSAELQSEIRSAVNGILVDIRQIPHNNKIQLTFIIKRIQ